MRIFKVSQHKKMWEYIVMNVDRVWQIKSKMQDDYSYLSYEIELADATIEAIKKEYFSNNPVVDVPIGLCYACDCAIELGCVGCPLDIGDCYGGEDSHYSNLCYCLLDDDMCGFVYWCNQIKDARINEGVVTDEICD